MAVWNALLLGAGLVVLAPMAVWSLECAAALLPPRRTDRHKGARRPSVAVLVPAHNEASVIRKTLDSLGRQILLGDRLVVIADNCTDNTVRIARECGSAVVERQDPVFEGKSYALEYGVRSIEADPPEVFVIIDADCTVSPGAIDRLARLVGATGRPVQANYTLESADQTPQSHIAELAFLIKNFVRPSGLDRLGLPCFLNGSGMAFPAGAIRTSILANGKIAEDKWLTVDFGLSGHVPAFCREAIITSRLPGQRHAQATQKTRWMHGHLECMLLQGPRLLFAAIRQRRLDLFGLVMDLCVPPLSLLLILWTAVLTVTIVAGLLGAGWLPATLLAAGGLLMLASSCAVVIKFGRSGALRSLLAGPAYVFLKLPVYAAFVFRRERKWVRTERDSLQPPE